MSASLAAKSPRVRERRPCHFQPLPVLVETLGCVVILIWTLMPLYTMVEVALENSDDVFSGALWPDSPSLHSSGRC